VWFRPSMVATLLAQEGTSIGEATWSRLADSAMVVPADAEGDAWRFSHALVHDAAYAGMLASRRRVLHARVADQLESRTASAAPGHIAMHRVAAGDIERALPLLREAASSALALGAAEEAARLWRKAAGLASAEGRDGDESAADEAMAEAALAAATSLREAVGPESPG
jgi:predicted ATPase